MVWLFRPWNRLAFHDFGQTVTLCIFSQKGLDIFTESFSNLPSWQVNFETLGLRYFYVLEGKKGLEGELSTKGRSNVLIGYLIMGITFLILRFFYHVLPKKDSQDSLIQAEKNGNMAGVGVDAVSDDGHRFRGQS